MTDTTEHVPETRTKVERMILGLSDQIAAVLTAVDADVVVRMMRSEVLTMRSRVDSILNENSRIYVRMQTAEAERTTLRDTVKKLEGLIERACIVVGDPDPEVAMLSVIDGFRFMDSLSMLLANAELRSSTTNLLTAARYLGASSATEMAERAGILASTVHCLVGRAGDGCVCGRGYTVPTNDDAHTQSCRLLRVLARDITIGTQVSA